MKDFKAGDKVTAVDERFKPIPAVFITYAKDGVCVLDSKIPHRFHAPESCVFHGHNVTVEVKGEELPERLRLEDVVIPYEYCSNTNCYAKLPAPLAKQLREYYRTVERTVQNG